MKKILITFISIVLMASSVTASDTDVNYGQVDSMIKVLKEYPDQINRATLAEYVKRLITEGFIEREDIQDLPTEQAEEAPVAPEAVLEPTDNYAALTLLDRSELGNVCFTYADGSFYGIQATWDTGEELYYYSFIRDGEELIRLDGYSKPVGIVQIDSTVYIAFTDSIYKYDGYSLIPVLESTKDNGYGYIQTITTNGIDLYAVFADDPWIPMHLSGVAGTFYMISTSGEATKYGKEFYYAAKEGFGMAANADGDRIAYTPYLKNGPTIMRSNGSEYTQRTKDINDFYDRSGDYMPDNLIYYGNSLVANVKGSIAYYDENNNRVDILGDFRGDSTWKTSYRCQPGGSLPIETGLGDSVRIGYVMFWSIGDDGNIYGLSMDNYDRLVAFKLSLPEKAKAAETYKKLK